MAVGEGLGELVGELIGDKVGEAVVVGVTGVITLTENKFVSPDLEPLLV